MTHDTLAEIDGIKPQVLLQDGEEREVGSLTSKSVYKVKRFTDHYYCSCPAWRNQKGVSVDARTCKHIRSLLGDEYENARVALNKLSPEAGIKSAKGKAPAKRKKVDEVDEHEDSKDQPKAAPRSKRVKKTTDVRKSEPEGKSVREEQSGMKEVSSSRMSSRRKRDDDEEVGDGDIDDDDNAPPGPKNGQAKAEGTLQKPASTKSPVIAEDGVEGEKCAQDAKEDARDDGAGLGDELAVINGIRPKVLLKDGEQREMRSMTSTSVYKIKRTYDHYYCSCPAWRNQGGHPVNARTCKHLKSLLGDAYETARLLFKNPYGPAPKGAKSTKGMSAAARKQSATKRTGDVDDDGDEEEDVTSGKAVPELLLANKWDLDTGMDPTGWWMSEKLDGVRTFYDGKKMISRLGNPFTPPPWFLETLPKDITLDGELFGGRKEFQSTVSIVKSMNSPLWKGITFQIFDIPSLGSKPFEERIAYLKKTFGTGGAHESVHVKVVNHELIQSRQHVLDELKEIEALGGEGLMLREPGSQYEGRRSATLFKVKTFYDAEAIVTGYVDGKGRHKGTVGALKCRMASGKTFSVGTGLSDKQRQNPPKINTIIVYRFQELTKDGVPRFPSFVGEAADKDEPKDYDFTKKTKATPALAVEASSP